MKTVWKTWRVVGVFLLGALFLSAMVVHVPTASAHSTSSKQIQPNSYAQADECITASLQFSTRGSVGGTIHAHLWQDCGILTVYGAFVSIRAQTNCPGSRLTGAGYTTLTVGNLSTYGGADAYKGFTASCFTCVNGIPTYFPSFSVTIYVDNAGAYHYWNGNYISDTYNGPGSSYSIATLYLPNTFGYTNGIGCY